MFADRRRIARLAGGLGRVAPRKLDDGVWLWRRAPGRLRVRRIGPEKLGSFLLTNAAAIRRHPRAYQHALSTHLSSQLLEALLRQLEVNVVLDVGANRGQFAQHLRKLGYLGRIVSYEPVSTNLAELRKAADADPQWLVEDFALGDTDSTAEINVSAGTGVLSSLLPGTEFGRERFENMRDEVAGREMIRVRRLDAVFERAVEGIDKPRVFLKLDTQGYDLLALAGAGGYVKEIVGLQSEVSCIPIYDGMPHLTEQIAAYEEAGFAAAGMFPVTRDHKSLAVIEFDLLMLRREAI
jgi:FkbM family methyltransferase